MESTVTSKGQIVIPSSVRRKLGITEGTRVMIDVDPQGRIVLTPITRQYIQAVGGRLKGKNLLKAHAAERQGQGEGG